MFNNFILKFKKTFFQCTFYYICQKWKYVQKQNQLSFFYKQSWANDHLQIGTTNFGPESGCSLKTGLTGLSNSWSALDYTTSELSNPLKFISLLRRWISWVICDDLTWAVWQHIFPKVELFNHTLEARKLC